MNAEQESALQRRGSPTGWLYTIVMISVVKRYLTMEIPEYYRLKLLEWLEKESIEWGQANIAAVDAMCDSAFEMVKEARKLGTKKEFDTYARPDVFNAFAALNPSLLKAIRRRNF